MRLICWLVSPKLWDQLLQGGPISSHLFTIMTYCNQQTPPQGALPDPDSHASGADPSHSGSLAARSHYGKPNELGDLRGPYLGHVMQGGPFCKFTQLRRVTIDSLVDEVNQRGSPSQCCRLWCLWNRPPSSS